MKASFDFTGAHVLVTGASRGIGHGIAEAFVRAGASVAILAEDSSVEAAARALGHGVVAHRADIADGAAVERALARQPAIDVLVNNAGLERLTPVDAASPETDATFRRIIDINVNGSWNVTRAALPRMRSGGCILFTSSIWGKTAEARFSAYAASKHAVIGMARSLARELGPRGIRVNAVCPGWVRTESSIRSAEAMAASAGISLESYVERAIAGQALGGLMEPADVAGLYLFLASDAASSITGQAFTIDRGETLQ